MKGDPQRLLYLLQGAKTRFIIPVYQRNYDWKIEHCKRLFDDLEELVAEGRESHFFGSTVSVVDRSEERVVIDGQQRITTVFLLLAALVRQVEAGVIRAEDDSLVKRIRNEYLTDQYHADEQKLKLKLIKDDQLAYEQIFSGSDDELIQGSNITQNYHHFIKWISETSLSADELLRAIDGLEVIDIKLDHSDDAQLIFESLNSTGLDLSEGDKIRNYILMGLTPDLQEEYYEKYWNRIEKNTDYDVSSFVRDYLAAKRKDTPALRKVYAVFREYVKKNELAMEPLLADLLKFSKYTYAIAKAETRWLEVDVVLRRLRLLEMSVLNPYLLCLFDYCESDALSGAEIAAVLNTIEIYLFRRWVCQVPANALNKIFETLHGEVVKGVAEGGSYPEVLNYILLNKESSGRFPANDEFLAGLDARNFYQIQNKKLYLWDRLENGDSRERANVISGIETEQYSVEHIMPQTLSSQWKADLGENYQAIFDTWLNRLANLTLTGYNSEYSNNSFLEKRDMKNGFVDSGLRINRYIGSCEQWGETELIARNEQLKEHFLELWPQPTSNFVPKGPVSETHGLDEDFDFTNRKIAAFIFLGTRYQVKSWVDMICKVLTKVYEQDGAALYHYAHEDKGPARYFSAEQPTDYYRQIGEGLYFNPGSSTETKFWILRDVFQRTGIAESELAFELYRDSAEKC